MRAGSFPLSEDFPLTQTNTEVRQTPLNISEFGSMRGTDQECGPSGQQACSRVPDRVPSYMGADRKRAAWCASGKGSCSSYRVRPNKTLSRGCRGTKSPAGSQVTDSDCSCCTS